MENDATAAFAKGRKSNPLELLSQTLGKATSSPDVRPGEQGRGSVPALVASRPEETVEQEIAAQQPVPVTAPPQQIISQRVESQRPEAGRDDHIEDDGASYRLPSANRDEVNRGGRPRHGSERKVERTISMDKSLDKILLNLAIIESLRLGRRVSSAEVAVHLMQYGLSNMKDNQILPGDDGCGLELASEAPTAVVLPKIGGIAR